MAQPTMKMELPIEVMQQFEKIEKDADKIMGGMVEAGAEVVYQKIVASVPKSFQESNIMGCLKITKVFKTPTDEGINAKVGFYGYFLNHENKWRPAPLVANVFEYGSSKVSKQPFLRKSFSGAAIKKAMLQAQEKLSGGLLK